MPAWVLVAMWAVGLVAFLLFSIDYTRRIDELDLLDNLWAAHWAFMFYLIGYPTWDYFSRIGMAPPPDHLILWLSTAGVLLVVYVARKLGLR